MTIETLPWIYDPSPLTRMSAHFDDSSLWWFSCNQCHEDSPKVSARPAALDATGQSADEVWGRAHPCYVEWFARTGGNPVQPAP